MNVFSNDFKLTVPNPLVVNGEDNLILGVLPLSPI